MGNIEGLKKQIDETFEDKGLNDDSRMLELHEIATHFKISKQSLTKYCKEGSLKNLPKSEAKNTTRIVQVRHLKDFFLSNAIKQMEHPSNTNTK